MSGIRLSLTIFATVAIVVMGSQDLRAQRIEKPLPPSVSDLQQAQVIEIKNDAGATVLKGTFDTKEDKSNEIERKTKLSGVSGQGSAEIEVSKKNGQVKDQELEVELERLLYGAPYKIFLDNKEVFAFSADSKGKANLKLSSKITK
jgi:hypothetical protein